MCLAGRRRCVDIVAALSQRLIERIGTGGHVGSLRVRRRAVWWSRLGDIDDQSFSWDDFIARIGSRPKTGCFTGSPRSCSFCETHRETGDIMSEFANAHTAILRLLDAIQSYEGALGTKDLDPAVLESVIQDVNESLGDSYPKLELPHQIPSDDESQRLISREMEAVLREAEEAIKPIARNLMRVHGRQPVDHAGVPASSWSHWVVAFAGRHRGARVWASLGGPKPQPVPFDSPYVRACLQLEYAALAEPETAACAGGEKPADLMLSEEVPQRPPPSGAKTEQLRGESKALALLLEHQEWTDTRIAEECGCHRTTLYKWKKFTSARAMMKEERNSLPRGQKDAHTGDLEAWE